jgi:hypothetical protein
MNMAHSALSGPSNDAQPMTAVSPLQTVVQGAGSLGADTTGTKRTIGTHRKKYVLYTVSDLGFSPLKRNHLRLDQVQPKGSLYRISEHYFDANN